MCRVSGWRLRWSSTAQPSITGSCMSRTIASGLYSCASARPTSPRSATMPLKPRSRATSSTVFANVTSSSTISTKRSSISIVPRSSETSLGGINSAGSTLTSGTGAASRRRDALAGQGLVAGLDERRGLKLVGRKSVKRRSLADARRDVDLASEEARDLPADREAEPGAAVAPARRAVRLLERLEDQPQLVLRDPDSRVGDREGDDVLLVAQRLLLEAAALRRRATR